MKVNTDGVLLGALADVDETQSILDIGTGTGVISLMLAQRQPNALVDAVEIDEAAAATAAKNFKAAPFESRLTAYHASFKDFFEQHPARKYDLIVSNPPFHLNSLKSTGKEKAMARHAGDEFFKELMGLVPRHLTAHGRLILILPEQAASLTKILAVGAGLCLQQIIHILSYPHSIPHREIIIFGVTDKNAGIKQFTIYAEEKRYSAQYRTVLSNFLTIF